MLEFVILGSCCYCTRGFWMSIWVMEGGCVGEGGIDEGFVVGMGWDGMRGLRWSNL